MKGPGRIFSAFCVFILFGGCMVSKNRYVALEGTLQETEARVKACEGRLASTEGRLKETESALDRCNQDKASCLRDYEGCTAQQAALGKDRAALARETESLRQELSRGRETIQDQKRIIVQLDETRRRIQSNLQEELSAQAVRIEEMEGKLKVTFVDKILFDTGSAEVNPRGRKALGEIAKSLKEAEGQTVVVEGHTDQMPIGAALRKLYPSNWELSTARAAAVVRFLQEEGGLEPERLSATGYGPYRPLAPNETEEGRRENRRIEIILVPETEFKK